MNLDFLNDISLKPAEVRATRAHVDTAPVSGADLRLFKDGRVFPSEQLVEDNNLEYVTKGDVTGNGFDIIDSAHFPSYPAEQPRLVMISEASKDQPKVDLFGSVGYDDDGNPKTSVITQGSKTTGAWMIELLEEVYGEELFPEGVRYVDLKIRTEFGLTTPNNIYLLPKKVARGANKGTITYQRRTDTTLWPLVVLTLEEVEETVTDDAQTFESPEGTATEETAQDIAFDSVEEEVESDVTL